jgi:hypothetical protein
LTDDNNFRLVWGEKQPPEVPEVLTASSYKEVLPGGQIVLSEDSHWWRNPVHDTTTVIFSSEMEVHSIVKP